MTHAGVEPRLAATVVLLRSGRAGLEVLLTRRPSSMAFAPDMHVFPGGRVDAGDADPSVVARSVVMPAEAAAGLGGDLPPDLAIAAYIAAIREVFEESGVLLADGGVTRAVSQARSALVGGEATFTSIVVDLDLTLRTDRLIPLSRWVTPPILPRRFDARFFAAELPGGARVSFEGDEVAGHAWMTPAAALAAMAGDALAMWIPTSGTLQQLQHAESVAEIRERLAPGALREPVATVLSPEVTRIAMPAGGGVAGQPIAAYLVGRRRFVLVDPGDPTGPGLELAMAIAAERRGAIDAIALTQVAPDHAAGAEGLAEMLAIPILGGPGAGRPLPFEVQELTDLEDLAYGDVPMRAVHTPGPAPEHLAFAVAIAEMSVIVGDLDGAVGARSIPGPIDAVALAASRDRVAALLPTARWLEAHPADGAA